MKKICLTLVAASAMIFSTQNLSAQEITQDQVVIEQEVKDYVSIEVEEVPTEVTDALERDYEGATISEAFVKEKDGEKTYKLKVTTVDGEEKELYADAEGNWIEGDQIDE